MYGHRFKKYDVITIVVKVNIKNHGVMIKRRKDYPTVKETIMIKCKIFTGINSLKH